ncbi:glycosyl hydrolase family 8 [Amycolatopsis vastitatis]|uniref:glycosyl hydrolase family 8 n=1 Tax=Amycolatopsis vastitatis TaxID=1905142 RepID=UPI001F0A394F|nr:glycosyl hydrolase family 8 [Amycolatopsis vastitatis]
MTQRCRRTARAGGVALALITVTATAGVGPADAAASRSPFETVNHPFPAHVTYATGVLPSASQAARDTAVERQYDSWKATYLVAGCAAGQYYVSTKGDDDAPNNGPVSESQGYGMNIVPLMAGYDVNAKAEFDGLWNLVSTHRDGQGMMQWQLDGKTCKYADSGTPDSATDGDLDIGYGLLLADKQWGGYSAAATDWLAKFYAADVAPDGHLKAEDDGDNNVTRPSDHMYDHLRAFAAYDKAHDWNKVITRTEAVDTAFSAKYSPTTGLLSDFVLGADTGGPSPAPAKYRENQPDNIVGYNSIRVPWHLGTDALLNGSTAAVELSLATKESACLKAQSGGVPTKVYPHTNLDCTPHPTDGSGHSDTQAEEAGDSIGPAAMAAGDQAWTDAIWNELATNPFGDPYYGETIKMLVYIVMAGDYWSPTGPPGGGTGPAAPAALSVTGTTNSSISLSWTEQDNTDPAVSYKVYEGSAVVATPTGTTATISGLSAGTSHTYTVTAVDAAGLESPHSGPVTGTTGGGTGGGTTVTVTKTADTGTGIYTDQAVITNNSGADVHGWNVQFDLSGRMTVTSAANAVVTSSAHHWTLTNTAADATIAAGGTLIVTFNGTYTKGKQYVAPTNVTLRTT